MNNQKKAREIKKQLQQKRRNVKATLKDIQKVIDAQNAAIKALQNDEYTNVDDYYKEVHKTKLYKQHGAEFCQILEIL